MEYQDESHRQAMFASPTKPAPSISFSSTLIRIPFLLYPIILLTATTDREEALVRHVDDSLALLPILDRCAASTPSASSQSPLRLIDVGTGAGLPGMILAIARPLWHVTLLDSLKKRTTFLQAAVAEMDLVNVDICWARAEDAGQDPTHREQYNLVIARAVAELRILSELCLPFVALDGHFIAAKGGGVKGEEEVVQGKRAIKELGGRMLFIKEVDSIGPHGNRTAVVVQKEKKTPGKYPRRPGTPKKDPL